MKIPGIEKLNETGKGALIDMTFNMGKAWYKGWPTFLKNLQAGNMPGVVSSLENSKWYNQVYPRSKRIIGMISNSLSPGEATASDTVTSPDKSESSVTASSSPPVSTESTPTIASTSEQDISNSSETKKQPFNYNYGKIDKKSLKDDVKSEEAMINKSKSANTISASNNPIANDMIKTHSTNTTNIPLTTNNVNVSSNRNAATGGNINRIIEQIFPNIIISFETAVKTFALGQSPFAAMR